MRLRLKKISQKDSSAVFTSRGLHEKYGISLERKYSLANRKAMVLFPKEEDLLHNPLILFDLETGKLPVTTYINYLFLERGFNPLYFSRNNILRLREMKTGMAFPLNQEAVCPVCEILDSG